MSRISTHTLGVALAATLCFGSFAAYGDDAERTTNDGVYSWDQSLRGQQAFQKNCAVGCHLADMTGSERAPGLAGDSFMLRWNGQTVGDLFLRIQMTMPQTAPHSLDDKTYADIVAYILSANGLPDGEAELGYDASVLKTVRFVPAQ